LLSLGVLSARCPLFFDHKSCHNDIAKISYEDLYIDCLRFSFK
jgi:hypothetical protein